MNQRKTYAAAEEQELLDELNEALNESEAELNHALAQVRKLEQKVQDLERPRTPPTLGCHNTSVRILEGGGVMLHSETLPGGKLYVTSNLLRELRTLEEI